MRICLDPGHGGSESGAVANNLIEKNINLVTALACYNFLKDYVEVILTRNSDIYVGLSERSIFANNQKANYFVSIHHNAGGGDGAEVIYAYNDSIGEKLANSITKSINSITGQNLRKNYYKLGDGSKDYYAVIRETNMCSIIVECAFIDSQDVQIVDTKNKQEAMGIAIAKGILDFLNINYNKKTTNDNKDGNTKTSNISIDKIKISINNYQQEISDKNKSFFTNLSNQLDELKK